MLRRVLLLAAPMVLVVGLSALPATSVPVTTLVRTIQDLDDDHLLEFAPGEDYIVLEGEEGFRPPKTGSILNFLQLTDFQLVDEESPGRVEFLDTTQRGPLTPFSAAYRPMESLTTQVEEAMVRAARNTVSPITGERLDLSILTGDNADNQQYNETRWFIDILDGTAGRRDRSALPAEEELLQGLEIPEDFTLADKIDPNSGIPIPGCEATPGTIYDGVRNAGRDGMPDDGYYEPDSSGPNTDGSGPPTDGDGYTPNRVKNMTETGEGPQADVTVRDFPKLFEAANHPFEAIGVDMPWYSAFGNHDALLQGNSTDGYLGPGSHYGVPQPPDTEIWNPQFQLLATGCLKPQTAAQREALLKSLDPDDPVLTPQEMEQLASIPIVPPDPRRCFIAKDEPGIGTPAPCSFGGWIEQHFFTTGTPVGHGFEPAACTLPSLLNIDPDNPPTPQQLAQIVQQLPDELFCTAYGRPPIADFFNDGYYSFAPRDGLRFIVLDTVTDDCGTEFCEGGSVDHAQFRWLEEQIEAAAGHGEYVMVFSHHTLRTTRWPVTDVSEEPIHYGQRVDRENPFNPQNPATVGQTLEELYCQHPNVLAHIAGHEHENFVRHYECEGPEPASALGPGNFWHISTAAHIDWPQQSRMVELIDNGNATMSLVLTMLDHAGPPKPGNAKPRKLGQGRSDEQVLKLASIAREIAYNDYQGSRGARGSQEDRNVIIVLDRPWPHPTDNNGGETGGLSLLP